VGLRDRGRDLAALDSGESWQGAAVESLPDLPPRVPEELPELDRALQLLRAVCAGKLKDKLRIELEGLVGGSVTQQLAAHWKTHLGEIRRDLAEELKRDPSAEVQPVAAPVAVVVVAAVVAVNALPDLPPRVPEELPELDRALVLLNALRQAGKLKDKPRIELEGLVGGRVTQQLAKHWGTQLAEIRRDLAEELKSDPEG
jgi:sRNA-binding protein